MERHTVLSCMHRHYSIIVPMEMQSSPAWSIAGRYSGKGPAECPGPGAYDQSLSKAGGFTLGSSVRSRLVAKGNAPGPGAYSPTNRPANGFSFGSGTRPPIALPSDIPGPGAYVPTGNTTGPKYQMTGKNLVEKVKNEGPGPGQYQASTASLLTDLSPYWSFGKDTKSHKMGDSDIPGPGKYEVRKGFEGKGTSFGRENRTYNSQSTASPGPGAYQPSFQTDRKAGASLTSRHPFRSTWDSIPGPGAYNLSRELGSDKGFSLSRATRAHQASASGLPGPGAYNPQMTESVQAPGVRSGNRIPIAQDSGVPGPGHYPISLKSNAPEYAMKGRHPVSASEAGPGPGQYSPKATRKGVDMTPNWSFGRQGQVSGSEKGDAPGPGLYTLKPPAPVPRWTFGNEPRTKKETIGPPGPGTYELKPTIPSVPSYLL